MLTEELSVDIRYMLTLRYDPTTRLSFLKNIDSVDLHSLQERNPRPPVHKIDDAIRRQIRNKIEELQINNVAVALSSGVDSNLILSLTRKEFPHLKIDCITVSFDGADETAEAKQMAEINGAEFHGIYLENPLKDLPKLVSICKEPRWNLYQYYLFEKAGSIGDVLLTGDGGDELFGGYVFRYQKFLEHVHLCNSWTDRARLYLQCHERDWVPDQDQMFESRIAFSWDTILSYFRKYFDNNLEALEQVFLADYNGKLMNDFVPTNQRFFDYFDLKGVAPMLSDEVIGLAMSIPAHLKYDPDSGIGKTYLRKIIKRHAPMYNSDKKVGFGMDLVRLWRSCGKDIVTTQLEKGRIFEDRIINREWYSRSLRRIEERSEPRYINKMIQLLSLEVWYKMFVTNEITPNITI